MNDIVIAAPLSIEALLVGLGARGATVWRTGMGPARSRRSAARLRARDPGTLVVMGFAGALSHELEPGDLLLAKEVRVQTGESTPCATPPGLIDALRARGLTAHTGTVVSVGSAARGQLRASLAATGAAAVDMESAWLVQDVGRQRPVVMRVIVDTPARELSLREPWVTVSGGLRAALVLRRAAAALHEWVTGG